MVVALASAASAFPSGLQLERNGIASGELWRLWTGHLVHGSSDHLIYDAGAAALLFIALEGPVRSALRLLWIAPAVSLLLLIALPGLDHYYGLSGLLHAWTVLGAAEIWRRETGARSRFGGGPLHRNDRQGRLGNLDRQLANLG
ncbi:MAG: hypothetical protein ACI8WY_003642 [Planctomycetota bacterium]|jgi:hypothetical protein